MQTSIPGVYAAGDVRVKKFRQITTAVSDGTIAALEVIQSRRV
jgi:thioredoxin reductase (NADPH)